MSGGHWNYQNGSLAYDIFGFGINTMYGIGSDKQKREARKARQANPLEDKVISELLYDVFCLLHSYDYYVSCDTSEETYRADIDAFKKKWMKLINKERILEIVSEECETLKRELINTLVVNNND